MTGEPLTVREYQICDLVSDGLTNKEIAAVLHLSPNTVKSHLLRIFRKTGVTGRAGLARHVLHPPADEPVIRQISSAREGG